MAIRIPYTKYEFRPPKSISGDFLNRIVGVSLEEYNSGIDLMIENEKREFIEKHNIAYKVYKLSSLGLISVPAMFLLTALGLEDTVFIPVINGVVLISSVGFIGSCSFMFTYKSFSKYLKKKNRYYKELKKYADYLKEHNDSEWEKGQVQIPTLLRSDQMKQLVKLRLSGILSEEEFQEMKRKLRSRIREE